MKRKNVFKGCNVTIQADSVIESFIAVMNYHEIHLNGEAKVSASELLGFAFEKIASSKNEDVALMNFLKFIGAKDRHSEPLSDNDLKNIAKEIQSRRKQ